MQQLEIKTYVKETCWYYSLL